MRNDSETWRTLGCAELRSSHVTMAATSTLESYTLRTAARTYTTSPSSTAVLNVSESMAALDQLAEGKTRRAAIVDTSSVQRMRVPPKRICFELACCGRTIQRHCERERRWISSLASARRAGGLERGRERTHHAERVGKVDVRRDVERPALVRVVERRARVPLGLVDDVVADERDRVPPAVSLLAHGGVDDRPLDPDGLDKALDLADDVVALDSDVRVAAHEGLGDDLDLEAREEVLAVVRLEAAQLVGVEDGALEPQDLVAERRVERGVGL